MMGALSLSFVASGVAGPNDPQQAGSYAAPALQKSPAASTNWRDLSPAACGMACRYHRANDSYTLQALYLITKISNIEKAIATDSGSSAARGALGAFCKDSAEDLQACFSRYKSFQRLALLQIREAMGTNQEMIARLTSGRKSDGTVSGGAISFESGKPDEAVGYVPEVPTLTELETAYLKGNLKPPGGRYSASDLRKWSQDLVLSRNSRYLDFQKRAVDGNPYASEKSQYKLQMVKRSDSGEAEYDKAAENEAAKSMKDVRDFAQSSVDTSKVTPISPAQLKTSDPVSYDALVEARSILNSKIEGNLPKDRAPASVPKAESDRGPDPGDGKGQDPGDKSQDSKAVAKNPPAGSDSKDIVVDPNRAPAGGRVYGPDEQVKAPAQTNGSRYIRYDLKDFFSDIQSSTK